MNALTFLIEIIEKLMSDPGKFENYQKELTTLYIDHADNQHVVSNAIELFFNHVSVFVVTTTLPQQQQADAFFSIGYLNIVVDRRAKLSLYRGSTLPLIGQH